MRDKPGHTETVAELPHIALVSLDDKRPTCDLSKIQKKRMKIELAIEKIKSRQYPKQIWQMKISTILFLVISWLN